MATTVNNKRKAHDELVGDTTTTKLARVDDESIGEESDSESDCSSESFDLVEDGYVDDFADNLRSDTSDIAETLFEINKKDLRGRSRISFLQKRIDDIDIEKFLFHYFMGNSLPKGLSFSGLDASIVDHCVNSMPMDLDFTVHNDDTANKMAKFMADAFRSNMQAAIPDIEDELNAIEREEQAKRGSL